MRLLVYIIVHSRVVPDRYNSRLTIAVSITVDEQSNMHACTLMIQSLTQFKVICPSLFYLDGYIVTTSLQSTIIETSPLVTKCQHSQILDYRPVICDELVHTYHSHSF